MLNLKPRCVTWIGSCLLAAATSLVPAIDAPASVIRIDGGFEDWKDIGVCASDPAGDARGTFDVTKVYAASQGRTVYLRFDTTSLLNIQNGPEAEGTLQVVIDLPNRKKLVIDTRGRRAYLNEGSKDRIPWGHLKYIVGPTYAQNEFEMQIDLAGFDVESGDTIGIQFDGSDRLTAPITFKLSQPLEPPKRRSPRRNSGTDVRIVSFNTYYEGLSDPDRQPAIARLLNSVDGDIYCFQEEWKTEGHGEILRRLMPLEGKGRWHIHKVHGDVIASKYPLEALPSRSERYAAAYVELAQGRLFIINVHLKAMGYIGNEDDRLRIRQANDLVALIGEIHKGRYGKSETPGTKPAIVIAGDFNLVGSRTPLDLIIDKNSHGLKDWLIPNLIGESIITWRGGSQASFSPGKLDYVVYSPGTLVPKNGFILNSELLNRTERRKLGLDASDSAVSDHLLMTLDFQFPD